MEDSNFYALMEADWSYGSPTNRIWDQVKEICNIALDIIEMTEDIARKIGKTKSTLKDIISNEVYPDFLTLQRKTENLLGLFESFLVKSIIELREADEECGLVEKPEPKMAEKSDESVPESEETQEENRSEIFDAISRMPSQLKQLKPEDIEAKEAAEELIEKKLDPLEELKKNIRDLRQRVDISTLKTATNVNGMRFVSECVKQTVYVGNTLKFAIDHGPNFLAVNKSILFFLGSVPTLAEVKVTAKARELAGSATEQTLQILKDYDRPMTTNEIAEERGVARQNIVKSLGKLKGKIRKLRDGQRVYYTYKKTNNE